SQSRLTPLGFRPRQRFGPKAVAAHPPNREEFTYRPTARTRGGGCLELRTDPDPGRAAESGAHDHRHHRPGRHAEAARDGAAVRLQGDLQVDMHMAWADSLAGLPRAEANSTNGWVAYDLEDWTVSGSDRSDPLGSLKRFGMAAHADGYRVIMAPGYHF